jgi:hypothetical protein
MKIRNFQPGDEAQQAAIYNEAAASLPKFKPATAQEVQRRTRARDFDPAMRFFVEEDGRVVGYAAFNPNGRVSYPWLLKGHENSTEPLFSHMLAAMRQRGLGRAFAAYRADWAPVHEFFLKNGFRKTRDMVNFYIDLLDMPTPRARPSSSISPVEAGDIPALMNFSPGVLQVRSAAELDKHLLHNPYFTADSVFLLRSRTGNAPVAVGILVVDPTYADPRVVDSSMPCYRLGAFGSEQMNTKRINGLFSFLAREDQNLTALGLDLMGNAAYRLRETDDIEGLAGQVPSDSPALLRFYERNFRRQGSFPIFERDLTS